MDSKPSPGHTVSSPGCSCRGETGEVALARPSLSVVCCTKAQGLDCAGSGWAEACVESWPGFWGDGLGADPGPCEVLVVSETCQRGGGAARGGSLDRGYWKVKR